MVRESARASTAMVALRDDDLVVKLQLAIFINPGVFIENV